MVKIRVIVIDDDVFTVKAICKKLKEIGVDTDGFTDPLEALEAIGRNKYPLIITDNSMPVIDGVELAERVLKIYNPVIVLTSVVCGQVSKFNLDEVFDYMFQKPLDYNDFSNEISKIIKDIETENVYKNIEVKDKLFVDRIVNILNGQENKSIYKKLSEEMHIDEATIRKRMKKIDKTQTPKQFILRIIKLKNKKKEKKEASM